LSDLRTIVSRDLEHPKEIGDRSTLAAMLGLKAAGYALLIPFGENTRYDLVIDEGSRLARVQCKTGRLRNGSIDFPVTSTYGHHRNPVTARRDYLGQIDFFAVNCRDTAGVYLVPIGEVNTRATAKLRVEPPRNAQRKRIRHAATYEVAKVPFVKT
jgi:hypothetical protein